MDDLSHVGMTQCFFCGEAKDVLLDRRLKDTLPRMGLYDLEPCQKCQGYMEQGIVLISFDESKTDFKNTIELPNPEYKKFSRVDKTYDTGMPNFYKSGGWCVVKDEAVERFPVDQPFIDSAIGNRWMFLTDEAWDKLELPRGEVEGVPTE